MAVATAHITTVAEARTRIETAIAAGAFTDAPEARKFIAETADELRAAGEKGGLTADSERRIGLMLTALDEIIAEGKR